MCLRIKCKEIKPFVIRKYPNLSFMLSRRLCFSTKSILKSTVGMLDVNLFRTEKGNDPEIIRESQRRRFADVSLVDQVIHLDRQWRARRFELDQINKDNNDLSDEIKKLKVAKQEATELIKKSVDRKQAKAAKKTEVEEAKRELDEALSLIGNLVHDSVPVDNDEANNSVVRTWGECRPKGNLLNHVDLVNKLQIVDSERGSKIAGGRGYFLVETGLLLNDALISFGKAFLRKRNYKLCRPPFLMRKDIMARCAQLSQFDEELYKVEGDGDANEKYLIATSEQPLCAYHMDKRIYQRQLPLRYCGFSTCFRKEAGSHGRDTLGIFRVHQFEKVEQFCITSPNDNKSWEMHEEMLTNAEDFYKELGLPYRIVNVVSGALNDAAAKKYDLEAWFPASGTFRELVSCSNCTDFQSRNLEARYDRTKQFVHMLNCTLTAAERTICCILENYQTEDGVVVPEVLRPYMFGIDFLPFIKEEEM